MNCPVCGTQHEEDTKFCGICGYNLQLRSTMPNNSTPPVQPQQAAPVQTAPAPVQTAPVPTQSPAPQPHYAPVTPPVIVAPQPTIPPEYEPIGAWMYFLWQIVFSIPLVGFILLIVFSCGGTSNINLRNFARSYFCGLLICAIIGIVILVFAVVMGLSFSAAMTA